MKELAKNYNPKETEDKIYALWEKAEAFKPVIDNPSADGQKPFVVVIPPPNVTGSLHMGHALNNTIQDILIRRSRMRGVPTLWIPGTDHAGIATQNVVEKKLAKEGTSRHELGREEFTKEIWTWVDQYGNTIINQLKSMGCSCDWSRQRFTMDEGYAEAVKATFIRYYEKGWIYRGERVVNWCTRCQTSLSDIEVEYKEEKGKLYWIKYGPFTLATTRPETKLGDTAVAVHPDDKRYKDMVGKTYTIKGVNGDFDVIVIADRYVDPNFGTGAVKVTPAHDFSDYEASLRHNVPMKQIIDKYGKMMDNCGKYAGMKTAEAREAIVEDMQKMGLIDHIDEDYIHNVGTCYRCGKIIEPQPSKQWFVKMDELAKPAIEAVKSGAIKFTPERWSKVYLDWMENLRDWCISRQIWWGHQIPAWEKGDEIYVGDNPPEGFTRSEDVLDTWFSSALWPFATLGWPSKTEDLKHFYPTSVLSTARDILYLWVARMIFSGYEFTGEKPFSEVYIHPTVFNKEGKRMSKSLGTGVDPLLLIDQYGADAMRFGLSYINTGVQDLKFDEEAIKAGGKFANKLWNISRFLTWKLENENPKSEIKITNETPEPKSEADKIILTKLNEVISLVDKDLDEFKFGQAAHELYDFVWHDLADVYIEESKKELNLPVLQHIITSSIKLLHPIMPFVTEEIWQNLYENKIVDEKLLIKAKWPNAKSV
ncbi:MAG: valine--tRNA ligase [Candidatus Berkelbacteria bacterium]